MSNSQTVVRRKPVWLRLVVTIMPVAIVAILASVLSTPTSAIAQTALPHPDNIRAVNGTEIGDAVVTWDPVVGAKFYRIGWISISAFHAAGAAWREQFRFSEVEGKTAYIVKHLVPEDTYLFIVGSNNTRYGPLAWPEDMVPLKVPEAEPETSCLTNGTCLPITSVGTYSGTGDSAGDIINLAAGVYRFTNSRQNTDGNFFVKVVELASGDNRSVGIYGRGTGRGVETLTIYDDDSDFRLQAGNYVLEVDTDSDWEVTVDLLAAH